MSDFNKVILLGRLTRQPELRHTASGAAVCNLGLAVNRRYKQDNDWKDEVCYVDIVVWGKQGENCAQYLAKSSQILVDGSLHYRTWETDGGDKRHKLEVRAMNVQFLGKPGGKGESEHSGRSPQSDIPFR